MTVSGSHLQALIPLLFISTGVMLPLLFHYRPKWVPQITLAVISIGFLLAVVLFTKVIGSEQGYIEYFLGHSWSGSRFLASGQPIGIVLRTDIFGALLVLLITGVGILTTLYSTQYIPHTVKPHRLGYYYSLWILMFGGLTGICMTGDCFNFYVFLEVASITSYALVAIPHTGTSLEASFKYMLIGAFGSVLIVFGIALLFSATGTLNMAYAAHQIKAIMNAPHGSPLAGFQHLVYGSLALFIIGFSIKSAFFPTHAWLADAHPAAPSSVSAVLSGLVVKATGVFLLIRFLFSVFSFPHLAYGTILSPLLLAVAAVTIIGGSLFAIAQNDLKRMLAYSTIAQMGYILMGIGLLTPAGLAGSILHMINHAVVKALLFLSAGAIIYKTGVRDIRDMKGFGYRMPITLGCFTLGALSMVGIPPLTGFMSKWALANASLEAGVSIMTVVLLVSSLLNAVYYLRVIGIAYFSTIRQGHGHPASDNPGHDEAVANNPGHGEEATGNPGHGEAPSEWSDVPWQMAAPLLVLASAVIIFGFKVGALRAIIKPAVRILWG